MSDVNVISSTQEKKLLGAMESAISLTNSGTAPNEAIAKTANDNGLSPEFACRMVEAFNTSKTIKHLKDNDGEKRAETFDIADKESVLKLMYSPTEKSVEKAAYSAPFKFDFNKPEVDIGHLEKVAAEVAAEGLPGYEDMDFKTLMAHQVSEFENGGFNNPKFVAINDILNKLEHGDVAKTAASGCKTPGKKIKSKGKGRGLGIGKGKGPIGVPVKSKRVRPMAKTTVKQANSQLAEIKWARRELMADVQRTKEAAMHSMDKLANAFRMLDARPFDEIEQAVQGHLGEAITKKAMDIVWQRGPNLSRLGEKRADADDKSVRVFGRTSTDVAALEMVDALEKAAEAEVKFTEYEKIATPVDNLITSKLKARLGGQSSDPFAKKAAVSDLIDAAIMQRGGIVEPAQSAAYRKGEALVASGTQEEEAAEKATKGLFAVEPSEGELHAQKIKQDQADATRVRLQQEKLTQDREQYAAETGEKSEAAATVADIMANEQLGKADLLSRQQQLEGEGKAEAARMLGDAGRVNEQLEAEKLHREERRQTEEAQSNRNLAGALTTGQAPFYPEWLPNMISDEPAEVGEIMTPEHESKLRKIKLKLMVNDMISNDETLSAYAPAQVIDAVNEITTVAPSAATNKPLMRSLVGRFLQQGGKLDPSEIAQLLSIEAAQRSTGVRGT